MNRRMTRWLAMGLAAMLIGVACGGDDDDAGATDTGTETTDEGTTDDATDEGTTDEGATDEGADDGTDEGADDGTDDGAAADPSVEVTPAEGLSDGDTVTVAASGFTPGKTVGINQCADQSDPDHGIDATTSAHCNLQGIQTLTIGDDGTATAEYTVSGGPFGEAQVECTAEKDCVLSVGELTADPNAERATVKITFA